MPMIDRRGFLAVTGAGVVAAGTLTARQAHAQTPDHDPFTLGVASGDATWSRVVLWTRLVPDPLDPDTAFGMGTAGPQQVGWRIARTPAGLDSEQGTDQRGTVTADPRHGFAVHVDVGDLQPDSTYYYRFEVPGWTSPVGRTRTAPPPGRKRTVRFAVINCQNLAGPDHDGEPTPMYLHGLTHLAQRDDIDFVVYLGDYIYEFGRGAHIPPRTCLSLDDYRTRYGQYKSVPALQEVHRKFPVYCMADDHEYYNNVLGGAVPDDQVDRFNGAVEAYWEHQPLRSQPTTTARTSELTLYRRIRWGKLFDFFLTDVRQFALRSDILGNPQTEAFHDFLADTHSTWSVIGSGFPLSWFGVNNDWPGDPDDRDFVTDLLARRKAEDPAGFNPVALSGDFHCGLVTHIRQRSDTTSPLVATEFINAPMGSGTTRHFSTAMDPGAIRTAYNKGEAGGWESYRGYLSCEVTTSAWTTSYYLTDQQLDPAGSITHSQRWRLRAGAPVGSVHVAD